MTHLHIRVPTKTRLHELKMAWFFRNSSGSIFDDYSKFILFNKICSETNYISEHDINTLFRPPCLGRNLFRGGTTYVGKFCEKCPHYVPSDWVWAPKEKTFSSRSWRTDQEWVMTKSRIISRPAWSNSVDKYSLWPLTFMFEPKDMARLQTREERAQDNFKKDSTMTTFP